MKKLTLLPLLICFFSGFVLADTVVYTVSGILTCTNPTCGDTAGLNGKGFELTVSLDANSIPLKFAGDFAYYSASTILSIDSGAPIVNSGASVVDPVADGSYILIRDNSTSDSITLKVFGVPGVTSLNIWIDYVAATWSGILPDSPIINISSIMNGRLAYTKTDETATSEDNYDIGELVISKTILTPEPISLLTLSCGCLGIGLIRRRFSRT